MPNSKAAKIMQQMRDRRLLQDADITDFLQKNGMIGADERKIFSRKWHVITPSGVTTSTCNII
jgi:hypothetical protein